MTRLLLLIYCTLCIAQNRDHRERRPHRPYIEPKYSRLTPFTNEENFPEPVFGMAHGLPYESMKKDIERELAEHFPIMERGRPDREDGDHRHGEPPVSSNFPFFKPKNGKIASSRERTERHNRERHSSEERQSRPAPRHVGKEPVFPLPPWIDPKEFPLRDGIPRIKDSDEKSNHFHRPRPQLENSENSRQQLPPSRERRPPAMEPPSTPNGSREFEPGAGSASRPLAGRDSEDSGRMHRRHEDKDEKETPERRIGEKIIGVDMQMVAGVYPKITEPMQLRPPLNGRENELPHTVPPQPKSRGLRRKFPLNDASVNVKEETKMSDEERNSEIRKTRHFGDFDGYFKSGSGNTTSPVDRPLPTTPQTPTFTSQSDTTRQTNGSPQITLPANGHDVNRETSSSLPSTSTEPDDQRTWAQTTSLTTTSLSSEKERGERVDTQTNKVNSVKENNGYNDYRLTTEQLTAQKLPCLGCAQVSPFVSSTMPPIARISSQTGVSSLMDKPSSPLLPSQNFALPLPNDQFNFRDIRENQGVGCRNRIRSPDSEAPRVSSTESFSSSPSVLSVPTVTVSFLFTIPRTPQKANISHSYQEASPAYPNL